MKNHTYEIACIRCGNITQLIYAEVSAKGVPTSANDMDERYHCRNCDQETAREVTFVNTPEVGPRRFSMMID